MHLPSSKLKGDSGIESPSLPAEPRLLAPVELKRVELWMLWRLEALLGVEYECSEAAVSVKHWLGRMLIVGKSSGITDESVNSGSLRTNCELSDPLSPEQWRPPKEPPKAPTPPFELAPKFVSFWNRGFFFINSRFFFFFQFHGEKNCDKIFFAKNIYNKVWDFFQAVYSALFFSMIGLILTL